MQTPVAKKCKSPPGTLVFNTGRYYGEAGQRIVASLQPDGRVAFLDEDRGVDGLTQASCRNAEQLTIEWFMFQYDHGNYTHLDSSLIAPLHSIFKEHYK